MYCNIECKNINKIKRKEIRKKNYKTINFLIFIIIKRFRIHTRDFYIGNVDY